MKSMALALMACLGLATAASAHGGGDAGGAPAPSRSTSRSAPAVPMPINAKPTPRWAEAVGIVKAVDTETGRVTISYQEITSLGWPAGTMPFRVSKPALMNSATVGEKVRFKLESQQITELAPF